MADGIHPAARAGFGAGAEVYQRARPGYPGAALALLEGELGLGRAGTVLEVAAGTGKLTRQLRSLAPRLVAVEPVEAMRRVLLASLPGVAVVAGRAEALPLRSGSAGAALVGQAFHWFDGGAALLELLRPQWPLVHFLLLCRIGKGHRYSLHPRGGVSRTTPVSSAP